MPAHRKQTNEDIEKWIEVATELRLSDPEPNLFQIVKIAQEIALPEEKRITFSHVQRVQTIIDGVKRRFGMIVQKTEKETNHLESRLETLTKRLEKVEKTLQKRRPRIAIAGLKAGQFHRLEEQFADRVRLVLIDIDQANPSLPRNIDYLFTSRFVQHRNTEAYLAFYERDQVIWVDGGLESFSRGIEELL